MPLSHSSSSTKFLIFTTTFLFAVIFLGQFVFALYILGLYGISGVAGDFERWNTAAPHGYEKGDVAGNIFFGMHMALAAILTLGGPMQLIKTFRRNYKKFHRLNGRIYIVAALFISLAGFYLVWVKGSVGGLTGATFISVNGVLILLCAYFTLKKALNKYFFEHQKWAIRLFLAMSGVWFFRVLLMLWLTIFQEPYGYDPVTFQGPALIFLYSLSYICPILFAEYYFRIYKISNRTKIRLGVLVLLITLAIALGSFSATMGMWLPNI